MYSYQAQAHFLNPSHIQRSSYSSNPLNRSLEDILFQRRKTYTRKFDATVSTLGWAALFLDV